jgi:hypothetical protein
LTIYLSTQEREKSKEIERERERNVLGSTGGGIGASTIGGGIGIEFGGGRISGEEATIEGELLLLLMT